MTDGHAVHFFQVKKTSYEPIYHFRLRLGEKMWCHLCKLNFTDTELFRCHIMEKHRPESAFYKDSDYDDSDEENIDVSENFDSDLEGYNEDDIHIVSAEDALQLSSGSSIDESPLKASTPKPSVTDVFPDSQNAERHRSNHPKKLTFKLKARSPSNDSDDEKEEKNSEPSVDNQLYVVSSVGNQMLGQQPMYIINPLCSNVSQLNANGAFALKPKNITKWLNKHKELCKDLKYPLPPQLYKKVMMIHKELANHYCMAPPSEENRAILKVYENLDNMIQRHIACINAEL